MPTAASRFREGWTEKRDPPPPDPQPEAMAGQGTSARTAETRLMARDPVGWRCPQRESGLPSLLRVPWSWWGAWGAVSGGGTLHLLVLEGPGTCMLWTPQCQNWKRPETGGSSKQHHLLSSENIFTSTRKEQHWKAKAISYHRTGRASQISCRRPGHPSPFCLREGSPGSCRKLSWPWCAERFLWGRDITLDTGCLGGTLLTLQFSVLDQAEFLWAGLWSQGGYSRILSGYLFKFRARMSTGNNADACHLFILMKNKAVGFFMT